MRFLRTWAPVFIGLFLLAAPALSLAQTGVTTPTSPTGVTQPTPPTGVTCPTGSSGCFQLTNPLNGVGTFCQLLKALFNNILIVGIPVAVLFIVYAGFRLVAARGNEKGLEDAKRNLYYIVIGIALFLGAWTLAQVIAATLSTVGAGGGLC